jgi:hypothetical protein
MASNLPIQRLEAYTLRYPQEVLLVSAHLDDDEADQVVVFRGFSSSLMRPTAFDPEVPVLPATARLDTVDRLLGPYTPDNPQYLEQGITWATFRDRLTELGL